MALIVTEERVIASTSTATATGQQMIATINSSSTTTTITPVEEPFWPTEETEVASATQ